MHLIRKGCLPAINNDEPVKQAEIIPVEKCCGIFHTPDPGNAGGGIRLTKEFTSTLWASSSF